MRCASRPHADATLTLSSVDNDSATNDHALLSSLGYISVKFNYCVVAGRHAHTGLKAPGSFQTGEFKVDEKAKKLGGHHATYVAELLCVL